MGRLPNEKNIYADRPLYNEQPILQVYSYLSQQPDVGGVLVRSTGWWDTGGYYYLHHDVPIYYSYAIIPNITPYVEGEGDLRISIIDEMPHYVSHVVAQKDTPILSGFVSDVVIGNLRIQKAIEKPLHYKIPANYGRVVVKWLANKYTPNVTPFLP